MTAKSPNSRDRLLELSEQACNGTLDAEDFIQLDGMLSSSHRSQKIYLEYVCLYADLEKIAIGADRPPVEFSHSPVRARGAAQGVSAWLALTLAPVFLVVLLYSTPMTKIEPIAIHTPTWIAGVRAISKNASWKIHGGDQATHLFKEQSIMISEGCVELNFRNGTKVAAEGPAELTIQDDLSLRLASGTLRATLENGASGFRVLTETMEIIDRGTQFYVEIGDRGLTTSYVSQGLCDVRNCNGTPDQSTFQQLTAGECALVDQEHTLVPLDAERSREFADRMVSRFLSYEMKIQNVSPAVCVVPQPTKPLDHLFSSANRHVYLIPEQQHVLLEKDLIIPGTGDVESMTLPAGTCVDSFLVHNAFGEESTSTGSNKFAKRIRTSGHIVFGQPVLAVLNGYQNLVQTDAMFAPESVRYPDATRRQLEKDDQSTSSAADPHRMDFDFHLSSGDYDQVRVLVRAVN